MKPASCTIFYHSESGLPRTPGVLPPRLMHLSWHFLLPSLDLPLPIYWRFCHRILLKLSLSLFFPFLLCIFASSTVWSVAWADFLSFYLPLADFLEIIDLLMIPIFTFS